MKENLALIRSKIKLACERVGRREDEVLLLAVSKTKTIQEIQLALDLGLIDLGENKVQEIRDKFPQIDAPVRWHMIGHLQTNKVKYIVDKVVLIHGVDSISLAQEVDKRAANLGLDKPVDILLQVNVSGEASKSGVSISEAGYLAGQITVNCPNVQIIGLMTIAPFTDEPSEVRPYFAKLRELRDDIRTSIPTCKELSMGMSGDFEVAIEEGATIVRLGTSIFGRRSYGNFL